VLQEFGRRLGRDTIIYAAGTGAVLVVSLVTLVVFTHYMPPAEYGSLSILYAGSGALTILLNLIPLAGILRWVYVSGEADAGAADDPSRQAPGGTKRRALGTGCWLNLMSITVTCAILVPFRRPLADVLLGSSSASNAILLMIASGAAGSVFRLTTNVVRMERRPVAFSVITATRPLVSLAISVPLVIHGKGIDGALIGTIAGSLVPGLAAVVITRASYSAQFNWTDARAIVDLGFRYTLVIIGLYIVHNGDALVLSRFASHASVGIYRVAVRLSSIISYLVSAFLLAWAPLERSTLFQTVYDLHGATRMHSRMLTYFILSGLAITLGLGLAGDLVVQLSPPAYRSAANLIPFTSFAFVVYGAFIIIARTTYHQHRDFVHNSSCALAAIVYIGLSAWLVPKWGAYGLAVAASVGMAVATLCFRLLVPTATHYAVLEWRRLIGGAAISFACLALGRSPYIGHGFARAGLELVDFFVLYPAAMVLTGIVPRSEARVLRGIAIGVGEQLLSPLHPERSGASATEALGKLPDRDVALLLALIKDRLPMTELARVQGVPVSVLEARAARALRAITGAEAPEREDAAIGHWLFDVQGEAERDVVGNFLVGHGLARLTLHQVESAAATLKALPRQLWPKPAGGAGNGAGNGAGGGEDPTTTLELNIGIG
jgi:O-antigen/teichoic acid export membrane protein